MNRQSMWGAGTVAALCGFWIGLAYLGPRPAVDQAALSLNCYQRLELDQQRLRFRVSTPGGDVERMSHRKAGWVTLGDDSDECIRSFYRNQAPLEECVDAYYACADSLRSAVTVVMDIGGPEDGTEAYRTKIWLTGLSPEMAAARIVAQKDSMYCTWVRSRQEDCVAAAKRDSVVAWAVQQGGAYTPTEGGCK